MKELNGNYINCGDQAFIIIKRIIIMELLHLPMINNIICQKQQEGL